MRGHMIKSYKIMRSANEVDKEKLFSSSQNKTNETGSWKNWYTQTEIILLNNT